MIHSSQIKQIPTLRLTNEHDFFLKQMVGDLFTYSSVFCLDGVFDLAATYGFIIEYMKPGTKEYKTYGSMCCRITERLPMFCVIPAHMRFGDETLKMVKRVYSNNSIIMRDRRVLVDNFKSILERHNITVTHLRSRVYLTPSYQIQEQKQTILFDIKNIELIT
jgi:hypothetical protein